MVTYWGKRKKYRDMTTVKAPDFEAPIEHRRFMRGNAECKCICRTRHLPRNAILIRPKSNKASAEAMYGVLVKLWKKGKFDFMKMGSCQQQIRSSEVNDMLKPVRKHFTVSCVDNVDNRILQSGDIILSRIGTEQSIGKPHLIKSSLMWED